MPSGAGQQQVEQHQAGLLGPDDAGESVVVAGDDGGVVRLRQGVADVAERLRIVIHD